MFVESATEQKCNWASFFKYIYTDKIILNIFLTTLFGLILSKQYQFQNKLKVFHIAVEWKVWNTYDNA